MRTNAHPAWMEPLVESVGSIRPEYLSIFQPPADGSARQSAVLMLFGDGPDGPDVLLIERAHDMRSHPGQIAFPGGAVDPNDSGPVAAAVREAQEETGLEPDGVEVIGALAPLYLPPSNFAVTPVLAWWHEPSPISAVDPAEVASVHRVSVASLLDPDNRYSLRHPSGYVGPAFVVGDLLVWGFTGGLLARLFSFVGWERRWDADRFTELPDRMIDAVWRT